MLLKELDNVLHNWLPFRDFDAVDASLNGVQVGRFDKDIKKIAVAVDGCQATIEAAHKGGADALLVHHGLFWGGRAVPLTGVLYNRIELLARYDMPLIGIHLPLDADAEVGNNREWAALLELEDIRLFGEYKRKKIGLKGRLPEPMHRNKIAEKLFGDFDISVGMLPFGPEMVETVAIITGSATHEASEAIAEGLDLYLTGESSHAMYHTCLEGRLNVIFGGHYRTEKAGILALEKKIRDELSLETFFIDIPTGF